MITLCGFVCHSWRRVLAFCVVSWAAIGVCAFLIVSCTSTGATPRLQQAIADANIIVSGVSAEVTQMETLYPTLFPPATRTRIATDMALVQSALQQLQTAANTPATGGQLQVVETAINEVVGIAASTLSGVPNCQATPACSTISVGLDAATVLLPVLEITINQLIPNTAPPVAAKAVAHHGMSKDEARAVLVAAGKK